MLGQQAFDAVVSDARMPDVDGEAVLEFTRKQHPATVRLVLSGQVDARTGHRLASVAHHADHLDDMLIAEFGGRKWSDHA